MTEINIHDIKVIDDYLPKEHQQIIHEDLLNMDWSLNNSPYADFKVCRMFGINLYHKNRYDSQCTESIKQLTTIIEKEILFEHKISLIRILANMQGIQQYAQVHTDSSLTNCFSIIYHVNESQGDTCFYSDDNLVKSVPFKMGRMIMFPSHYLHQGMPPETYINPTNNFRISLGYCFETY